MYIYRTETVVNGNFTELILKNANLPLVLLFENVVHQSRLSSSQKAGLMQLEREGSKTKRAPKRRELNGCHAE